MWCTQLPKLVSEFSWVFGREYWQEFAEFLTHKIKASNIWGNFGAFFVRRLVTEKETLVPTSFCRRATLTYCERTQIILSKQHKALYSPQDLFSTNYTMGIFVIPNSGSSRRVNMQKSSLIGTTPESMEAKLKQGLTTLFI